MVHYFTPESAAKLFNRARNSIVNWIDAYPTFFSPGSQPGKGRRRVLTLDDMRVLALVDDRVRRGFSQSDISHQLSSGMREELPADLSTTSAPPPPDVVAMLQSTVAQLKADVRAAQDESVASRAQVELLTHQLDQARAELSKALVELGQWKARAEDRH